MIKEKLNNIHAVTVTSISLLLVGPIASIYLFGFTDFWSRITEVEDAGLSTFYICLLGVFGTAIALIIFNKVLQMKDALFASKLSLFP